MVGVRELGFESLHALTLRGLLVLSLISLTYSIPAVTNVTNLSCKRIPVISSSIEESDRNLPTVVIALLVRNKQITLPYFLGSLETLNYPKDRIILW